VPLVLLSGHHENIKRWRLKKRIEKTLLARPALVEKGLKDKFFDREILQLLEEVRENERNHND
jgi:tRNA (guanine37-N1)-methyltransferase